MSKEPPLTLPCLRGRFGDWVYYDCLFSLKDLAARVNFADDLYESKELSELIQRQLDGERSQKISRYLQNNDERFFNSLVVATYKGSPEWYDVANLKSSKNADILDEMPDGSLEALGLLRLTGGEEIFALDGQHRLSGIKKAVEANPELGSELVPVILVGHGETAAALRRTRRLFTTLNKTAVAVKKMDIIALDEDDVMAITARRLVEGSPSFKSPKIAVVSSEAMPTGNDQALLTIAGLYDQLKLIFKFKVWEDELGWTDEDLRFNRPDDEVLDEFHKYALDYFKAVGAAFPPIAEFLSSRSPRTVVQKYRTEKGGHTLFRTVGFDMFTRAAIAIAKRDDVSLTAAIKKLTKLPTDLNKVPYKWVIWNPERGTMDLRNKAIARQLLFHMLSLSLSERQTADLLRNYRVALGSSRTDSSIKLPNQVA